MVPPKTAQPTLRKIADVVATAVSGMSVYAQAAAEPLQEIQFKMGAERQVVATATFRF